METDHPTGTVGMETARHATQRFFRQGVRERVDDQFMHKPGLCRILAWRIGMLCSDVSMILGGVMTLTLDLVCRRWGACAHESLRHVGQVVSLAVVDGLLA